MNPNYGGCIMVIMKKSSWVNSEATWRILVAQFIEH